MNTLDDDDSQHHDERSGSFSFLSEIERSAVERMGSTVGRDAIMAMLSGLDRDALHSAISKFIQHEPDEARMTIALLNQQGSQQAELLRMQKVQNSVPGVTHARRPETLKIEIS